MLRLVPLYWVGLLAGLLVGLGGGARPRSYRGPALAELGHPDVTTGDAACLRRYSKVQQRDGVIHAPTGVGGGRATYFLRAYAGAPVAQTLRLSLLRCGERLCDTLRALPENVAAPNACWGKRAVFSTLRWER